MAAATLLLTVTLGIVFGTFSCIFFLWIWLVGAPSGWIVWLQLLISTVFAVTMTKSALPVAVQFSGLRKSHAPALILAGIGVYGAVLLAIYALNQPHGEWDAWAIWNMHARFLYRGAEHWTEMFTGPLYWSHTDYPKLLPSLVAGGWMLAGFETTIVPTALSVFFTVASIALIAGSVCILRGDWSGVAAGIVLMSAPEFLMHGSYQMGDIPLAFYVLLTLALMQLHEKFNNNRLLILAGLSAALAAWTKNEGLLFVLAFMGAWTLSALPDRHQGGFWRKASALAIGAGPVLLMIVITKFWLVPRNDLLLYPDAMLGKLADISRYRTIANGYMHEAEVFGGGPVNPLYGLAALFGFVAVDGWGRRLRTAQICNLLVVAFMFAGYFMVYVVTPHDVQWHLDSSLERLFLQLWPLVVLAVACCGLATVEDGFRASELNLTRNVRWLKPAVVLVLLIGIAVPAALSLKPSEPSPEPPTTTAASIPLEAGNGAVAIAIRDSRPLVTGYAQLTDAEGMAILSSGAENGSDSVILPSAPVRSATFPFQFSDGHRTSVAIVNAESAAARITISSPGQAAQTLDVFPNTQISGFLDGPPFRVRGGAGAVTLRSTTPFLISAFLTYDPGGPDFFMTSMPVATVDGEDQRPAEVPYAVAGDGWSTELILVNPSSTTLKGSHVWFDQSGQLSRSEPYSVPAEQSVIYKMPAPPSGVIQSRIQIVGEGKAIPSASAIVRREVNGLSGILTVPAVPVERHATLYVESSDSTDTEIRIVNHSDDTASLKIDLAGKSSEFTIAPRAALDLPLFKLGGFQLLSKSARTLVNIASDQPIAVAALRYKRQASARRLSAVYSSTQPGTFLPYFASGVGFSTEFVLFGNSETRMNGVLHFLDRFGKPFEVTFVRR